MCRKPFSFFMAARASGGSAPRAGVALMSAVNLPRGFQGIVCFGPFKASATHGGILSLHPEVLPRLSHLFPRPFGVDNMPHSEQFGAPSCKSRNWAAEAA